jgi:hypothetical protein
MDSVHNCLVPFADLDQIGSVTGQHSFLHEQSQIIGEKTRTYVNLMKYF